MSDSLVGDTNTDISGLVNAWCDRRAIRPLRVILSCYPLVTNLTDEWAALATALKTIRIQHAGDLEPAEIEAVVKLQHLAESVLHR